MVMKLKRWISFVMAIVMTYLLFAYMPSYARADAMTSSETLIEILKKREGFEKYPYKDNTQWSIGYGTRVPSGMLAYYQENGITQEEAEKLMRDMLKGFEKSILDFSANYGFSLTQNQFDALVSFSYNCGDGWTKESSGNMNRAVREGWTGSDFVYAMCLWSRSGSQYILINRRLYEANMYINNIFNQQYIQQQAQQQNHYEQIYNVTDAGKKLKDFLDSIDKIEPQYREMASAEFCAVLLDYLQKHNKVE